jgi:hypothetical protein
MIHLGRIGIVAILILMTKRRHSSSLLEAQNAILTGSMGIMMVLPARVYLERRIPLMQSVVIDRFEGDYAILVIAGSDESFSVLRDAFQREPMRAIT